VKGRSRIDTVRAPAPYGWIHELLNGLGESMDFVDEQDRAFLGIGEVGEQVLGGGEYGAAGDLQGDAQIARDTGGERGFAQARRTIEKNMPQRFLALAGGIDSDRQPLGHVSLPNHLVHVTRPKGDLVVTKLAERFARRSSCGFPQRVAREDPFAGHAVNYTRTAQTAETAGSITRRNC
jgi:hypothetical protein